MNTLLKRRWLFLFSILSIGIVLRTFQFLTIPPGLYVDEATAGYETLSLLTTGADRWGLHLPVYFVNWGSGQSVLYSYLSIPFVWLFGLSRFSVRLQSLFIGILALPLIYVTVRRRFGETAALVSMTLLAILPWHVMLSRWALEANLLPFFLLLGVYTLTRALEQGAARGWITIALVPWGLSLYAYAMSYIVVPLMLLFIAWYYRQRILENWKAWVPSLVLFVFFFFPIALFLIKNFVFHDSMAIERFLPFATPLLLTSRLQYVSSPIPGRWIDNFFFVLSAFQEGDYRSSLLGDAPIFLTFIPLALVGIVHWIRQFRDTKRPELFLVWMIASFPIFVFIDSGVTHFNSMILPILVAAVYGLVKLTHSPGVAAHSNRIFVTATSMLIGFQFILFVYDFFVVFPSVPAYESAFAKNYERAIENGLVLAKPSEPILIPISLEFSYIFPLFYTNYPPEKFQREVKYTLEYSEYFVLSFGRFYVGVDNLPDPDGPFVYVFGKWDADPCANPKRFWETRLWKVGRCE